MNVYLTTFNYYTHVRAYIFRNTLTHWHICHFTSKHGYTFQNRDVLFVKCHHSAPLRFAYGFSIFSTCFLISFLQDLKTLQELFKILGQQLPVGKIVGQRSFVTCFFVRINQDDIRHTMEHGTCSVCCRFAGDFVSFSAVWSRRHSNLHSLTTAIGYPATLISSIMFSK